MLAVLSNRPGTGERRVGATLSALCQRAQLLGALWRLPVRAFVLRGGLSRTTRINGL